jgi:hypothetical protein
MYLRFTILILTLLIFSSCSTKDDDTWTESRDALIGTWEGKVTFVKTNLTAKKDTTGTRQTKVRFLNQNDAIISEVLFFGLENNFDLNWTYQTDPESIAFVSKSPLLPINLPKSFQVIKKDNKTQTWIGEYLYREPSVDLSVWTEYKATETWEMTKQ